MNFNPDTNKHILESDFDMLSEIVPLFDEITESFKIIKSRETYLSKIAITICYIHDEIYEFVKRNINWLWYDNCVNLINTINDDIWHYDSTFTHNLLAAVVLDPAITKISSQIVCQLGSVLEYIESKICTSNGETFSPPIRQADQQMSPIDLKCCSQQEIIYSDEQNHWFTKTRPNEFKSLNPYKYWKELVGHKSLRKFTMKLFIHAGSSVSCEQFFSICSNVADDKRSSMIAEKFSVLCIVKDNIDLARRILFEDNDS